MYHVLLLSWSWIKVWFIPIQQIRLTFYAPPFMSKKLLFWQYSPWLIFQLISHGRWSLRLPPCKLTYKIFLPGKICLRGLRASIADFGFYSPVLESRWHQQFSLWKRKGVTEIWTRDHRIQSQLCLPLDHKLMKNAWKIKIFLAEHFQIQNLPTIW